MTLSNVSEDVLQRVQGKLPHGAVIQAAMSVSSTQSVFMVLFDEVVREATFPKMNISAVLKNRPVDIGCKEGDSLADILQLVSERYKLYLLPGVDYVVPVDKVTFEEKHQIEKVFAILEDSIALYGSLTVTLRNREKEIPAKPLQPDMSTVFVNLALLSSIFEVEDSKSVFLTNDQLSSGFAKKVVERLASVKLNKSVSVQQLGTTTVLDTFNDGISEVIVCKTLEGAVLTIRYLVVSQVVETGESVSEELSGAPEVTPVVVTA